MVVKQIIKSNADLTPDYQNQTLTAMLYFLSVKRYNYAVAEIQQFLNKTETIFPGISLKMNLKISPI